MSATVQCAAARASVLRRSPLAAPVATGCGLAAAALYVAIDNPSDGGVFIPCPFETTTGWWCPGCGLTRATHYLLRGDLLQALRFNMLVIVVLTTIVATWSAWLASAAGWRTPSRRAISPWLLMTAGAVLVGFAVVRNLPGIDGLRG